MKHFFVVLPSDSSMNYFPDNTVAHYKTKLSKPICDDGDYEVALTELVYPMNYHNFVVKEPLLIRPTYQPDYFTAHGVHNLNITKQLTWELKSGYYENVEALVEYLNTELAKFYGEFYESELDEPLFRYDPKTKKMDFLLCCKLAVHGHEPKGVVFFADSAGLNDAFLNRFGIFSEDTFELGSPQLMYVYCNIVSPYLVGDVQTPLLRVIAPKGERNEIVSTEFTRPYYIPVARRGFDTIEININDELGNPMPFTGGRSVVILHFRRNESVLPDAAFG